MVSVLDSHQTKPSLTLINQLRRIGEIRENLGRSAYHACGALGLRVQLSSYHPEASAAAWEIWKSRPSKKNGFWRLKAEVGPNVCLDACAKEGPSEDWSILKYNPGEWQALCQPTLHLCQWLHEWGGLHPEMQLTFQVAIEGFKETGRISIPLRQETGGHLCGRCGDEVQDLADHIYQFHDRPQAPLPLVVYLRVQHGRKSVMAVQGKGRDQHTWTVPEEFHRADLNAPSFQMGIASDIERIFSITGKSRTQAINGKYPLPNDITTLPYLANVLRMLTRGNGQIY